MDHEVRALERQAAQGDLEAQGQLLLLRVRSGELSRDRLALAAHLGHPPALQALGQADLRPELQVWVVRLERWGRPVLVRALVAAARWIDAETDDDQRVLQLSAAARWCDCPCRPHALEAYNASRVTDGSQPSPSYHAAFAAHVAGNMQGASGRSSLRRVAKTALREVQVCGGDAEALRAEIQRALVPWACGAA